MQPKEVAFVRDVSALILIAKGLTYREFTDRLRQIERHHAQQHRSRPYLAREIRRRTAEHLLKEAIQRGCSFGICRTRMKQLRALGFTDVETKAHHCLIYARAARAHGHIRVAHRAATEMVNELERSLRHRRSLLGKATLKALLQFLAEKSFRSSFPHGSKPWTKHLGRLKDLHSETVKIDRIVREAFENAEVDIKHRRVNRRTNR